MQNPFITGDRIYLRPIDVEDADLFVLWLNDKEIREYWGATSPLNKIREKEFLEPFYKDDRNVALGIVLKENDQLIGYTGLYGISVYHRRAELGILIGDKACWSKGYGTEAMNLILKHGFDQLNLHRIYLFVLDFNPRAIRAYEKVGFKKEGVFRDHGYRDGQYCDDYAMGILESEWREKYAESIHSW
jgi:RimJ/RimL family protein N-acetyltransferase